MGQKKPARWKTAWVIGASSGIGRELAVKLAATSTSVCISARSEERLLEISGSNTNIHAFPLDVTDPDAVAEVFAVICMAHQTPDLVVISSGHWDQTKLPNFDPAVFRKGMEVNYMGTIHVLNAIAPVLIERGSGQIGIISSVSGYRGLPNAAAYSPSKAALINLAESIAPQLARKGVSVSIINPGFVDTPMTAVNEFPMPFIISAEEAALRIISGLDRGKFDIAFPKRLAWLMNLLRVMPDALFFWIVRRFILKS